MAELIRSYVQASTQLPRSRWRRRLSHAAMLVWDDLIHWPTYSGVFRYDIEEAAWYYRIDPSDVDNALEQFVADGKIQRENDFVFVIDFVNFQNYSPPSYRAMEKELEKLEDSPGAGLAAVALQRYTTATPSPQQRHTTATATPIRYDTKRDDTKRDKSAELHSARLADLEDKLSPQVQMEWDDWKQMAAAQRKSGKVGTLKLCKHLERILAVKSDESLSDAALCYGLQSAIMAEADNHTYVLKSAANYKPGSYTPRKASQIQPGVLQAANGVSSTITQVGMVLGDDGQLYDDGKPVTVDPEQVATVKAMIGNLSKGMATDASN